MASTLTFLMDSLKGTVEVALLTVLIYSVLYFLRGSRAAPVLAGMTIMMFLLWIVSDVLKLEVINWLLLKMWAILAILILVIFQPEIRRVLAETGSQLNRASASPKSVREMIDTLVASAWFLAERRLGALIVVQQKIGMRALAETGTLINAPLNQELLCTFFFPNTPLHDGGVIVKDGMVLAAGCILPLTHDPDMAKNLGTRHRAGVGVTEETDAIVIIVSEETGAVSLAHKGRLLRGVNRQRLERHLHNILMRRQRGEEGGRLTPWFARLRQELSYIEEPEGEEEQP